MKSSLQVDAVSNAVLVNRYLAYCTHKKYQGGHIVEDKTYYKFQWQNVKADIGGIFKTPVIFAPRIALSVLAFWFVLRGRPADAYLFAFTGSLNIDDVGGTNQSGQPASITWTHNVNGSGRALVVSGTGLSSGLSATYDGAAVTSQFDLSPLIAGYVIAPATGIKTVAVSGGNIKIGGSISFTGADQTNPIGAVTTADGSASPKAMALTTTRNGSIRLDILSSGRDDNGVPSASLDAGTEQVTVVASQNQFRYKTSLWTDPIAVAGSTTRTWTTDGFSRQYAALEILPSIASSSTSNQSSLQSVRSLQNLTHL